MAYMGELYPDELYLIDIMMITFKFKKIEPDLYGT